MDKHENTCLNCNHTIIGKYCCNCGQSADTHRLSLSHFLAHDVVHGVFHLDRGLLNTIKQVLIRPGYAAMDYILGKRKSYYNFFYLILLLVGFYSLVSKLYGYVFPSLYSLEVSDQTGISDFINSYSKVILLGFVPVISFNSYILYRKANLNYLEHIIVSVFAFIGVLLAFVAEKLIEPIAILEVAALNTFLGWIHFITVLIYTNLSFYQAFRAFYSKKGIFWRFVLFVLLVFVEIVCFLALLISTIAGKGTFEF